MEIAGRRREEVAEREATVLIIRGIVVRIVPTSPIPNVDKVPVVFDERQNTAEVMDMRCHAVRGWCSHLLVLADVGPLISNRCLSNLQ